MNNDLDKVLNFNGETKEIKTEKKEKEQIQTKENEQEINTTETNENIEKEEKSKRGRPKKTENIIENQINNKENKEENNSNKTEKIETEENPIYELAKYLKDRNNWNDLEFENINDIDEFADIINEYVSSKRKLEINDPLFQMMYEYISLGGDTFDFINAINEDNNKLNINLQDENSKLNFLYNYTKETTNWDDNKIKSYINKIYEKGLLDDEVKDAIDYYINNKSEKIKNLLEEQKRKKEQIEETYKKTYDMYIDYIYNKPETILGEKIDKKTKDNFANFLFEKDDTGYTGYQKMLINSPELELKFAFDLYKWYINNNEDAIKKQNLINKLKGQIKTNNKINNKNENNNTDIRDALNKLFNY